MKMYKGISAWVNLDRVDFLDFIQDKESNLYEVVANTASGNVMLSVCRNDPEAEMNKVAKSMQMFADEGNDAC